MLFSYGPPTHRISKSTLTGLVRSFRSGRSTVWEENYGFAYAIAFRTISLDIIDRPPPAFLDGFLTYHPVIPRNLYRNDSGPFSHTICQSNSHSRDLGAMAARI